MAATMAPYASPHATIVMSVKALRGENNFVIPYTLPPNIPVPCLAQCEKLSIKEHTGDSKDNWLRLSREHSKKEFQFSLKHGVKTDDSDEASIAYFLEAWEKFKREKLSQHPRLGKIDISLVKDKEPSLFGSVQKVQVTLPRDCFIKNSAGSYAFFLMGMTNPTEKGVFKEELIQNRRINPGTRKVRSTNLPLA